jgi:hypothetical protein
MSRANRGSLFWGALLLLLGLVFLLNNFNLAPANLIQWWPVFVVGAGIWLFGQGLVERGAGRFGNGQIVAGTVLAALGGFWLLDNLGRADERLFVPILLIALGVGLLFRSLLAGRS